MENDKELPLASSYIDEVFTEKIEHSKRPTLKTSFKPWHKPRKQYVRKFQWLHEIEKLCKNLCFDKGRKLRYLSLPGTDMLDIRYLHSWCKKNEIFLQYLGYNDPKDSADSNIADLHLSQAELTQREYIDGNSNVVSDKFEKIGDKKSIAYTRMIEMGHFDVINLDLCESFAGHPPLKKLTDCYNAIANLIQHQKENRLKDWLLFITTRADQTLIDKVAQNKLFQHIKNNATEHDSFNKKLLDCFGIDAKSINPNDEKIYRRLVNLGLGKWILGLLINNDPKWKLTLLSSIEYKIQGGSKYPDMLSLAFECSRIVQKPHDKVGLTMSGSVEKEEVREIEFAIALIDSVRRSRNIDGLLNGEPNTYSVLIEETVQLIIDARYDERAYRQWVKNLRRH